MVARTRRVDDGFPINPTSPPPSPFVSSVSRRNSFPRVTYTMHPMISQQLLSMQVEKKLRRGVHPKVLQGLKVLSSTTTHTHRLSPPAHLSPKHPSLLLLCSSFTPRLLFTRPFVSLRGCLGARSSSSTLTSLPTVARASFRSAPPSPPLFPCKPSARPKTAPKAFHGRRRVQGLRLGQHQ